MCRFIKKMCFLLLGFLFNIYFGTEELHWAAGGPPNYLAPTFLLLIWNMEADTFKVNALQINYTSIICIYPFLFCWIILLSVPPGMPGGYSTCKTSYSKMLLSTLFLQLTWAIRKSLENLSFSWQNQCLIVHLQVKSNSSFWVKVQSRRKFSVHRHGPLVYIDFKDNFYITLLEEYNIWSVFTTRIRKHWNCGSVGNNITNMC